MTSVSSFAVEKGEERWTLVERLEKCLGDVNAVMEVETQDNRSSHKGGDHSSGNSHKATW
jgi:hypothetical protein